jgi:hypothetical protein
MNTFPAKIKRRIKVNRLGAVRQWPEWFPLVEKPAILTETAFGSMQAVQ